MTSLTTQLANLRKPESAIVYDLKYRPSILYDRKEAAKHNERDFLEIGLEGLENLAEKDEIFKNYNYCFFVKYENFERSIGSKEQNDDLNEKISEFFNRLSPFMLLKDSLKVLEWFFYKFEIFKYNIDDLMLLILPYHSTDVFPKILQSINLKNKNSERWHWLKICQKSHQPLAKQTLINHMSADISFLNFLTQKLLEWMRKFTDLSIFCKFYISCVFGAFNIQKHISEQQISIILPVILPGLSAQHADDLRTGSYMLVGQLCQKTPIKEKLLNKIVGKICNCQSTADFQANAIRLLVLIYDSQASFCTLPDVALKGIMQNRYFINCLADLQKASYSISSVIRPLFDAVFEHIFSRCGQTDNPISNVDALKCFTVDFLKTIHLNQNNCNMFFTLLINHHHTSNNEKLTHWCGQIMRRFERKYPQKFDEIIVKLSESNENEILKTIWTSILYDEKMNGQTKVLNKNEVFVNLLNPNVSLRISALEALFKNADMIRSTDISFLKSSLLSCFEDTHRSVILLLLKSFRNYQTIFAKKKLFTLLVNVYKRFQNDVDVFSLVTEILTSEELFDAEFHSEVLFVLLPHLFPFNNQSDLSVARQLLETYLFRNWDKLDLLSEINKENFTVFLENIFERFCYNDFLSQFLEDILSNKISCGFYTKTNTFIAMFLLCKKYAYQQNDVMLRRIVDELLDKIKLCSKTKQIEADPSNEIECLQHTLDLCKESVLPLNSYLYLIASMLKTIDLQPLTVVWVAFDNNSVQLKLEIVTKILNVLSKQKVESVSNTLAEFSSARFADATAQTHLLLNLIMFRQTENKEYYWSHLYALIEGKSVDESTLLAIVLQILSENEHERKLCMKCLNSIEISTADRLGSFVKILRNDISGIEVSQESVSALLVKIFKDHSNKEFLNVHNYFLNLLQNETTLSFYAVSKIVQLFTSVRSVHVFESLLQLIHNRILSLKSDLTQHYYFEDISNIVGFFVKAIGKSVLRKISESRWYMFLRLLGEERQIQMDGKLETISNCLLQAFSAKLMESIRFESQKQVFNVALKLLIKNGSKTTKQFFENIRIDLNYITSAFEEQAITLSSEYLGEQSWQNIIFTLELIMLQHNRNLRNAEKFIALLFKLLKKLCVYENQSEVEFGKRLTLSVILNCSKCVASNDELETVFDIESIVECLYASDNFQTHQCAIELLSDVAERLPHQVLGHIVKIFTFIGSSTARREDEYSFNLVTNVLNTILPILMNSTDKKATAVEILRVFVSELHEVPEYRRLRLFDILLNTLGYNNYLWKFILMISETNLITLKIKSSTKSKFESFEFALSLINALDPLITFSTVLKLATYLNDIVVHNSIESKKIVYSEPLETYDPNKYSIKEFEYYQFFLVRFLLEILSSNQLMEKVAVLTDEEVSANLQPIYSEIFVQIQTYIPKLYEISKKKKTKHEENWASVTLKFAGGILKRINQYFSSQMFLSIMIKLLDYELLIIRQEALDSINQKLDGGNVDFENSEQLTSILDRIVAIINNMTAIGNKTSAECEKFEQTALQTVRLLTKSLRNSNTDQFEDILDKLITLLDNYKNINDNFLSALILTTIEICCYLKMRAMKWFIDFTHLLVQMLEDFSQKPNDLLLSSCLIAFRKIMRLHVQSLHPYMKNILFVFCTLRVTSDDNKMQRTRTELKYAQNDISQLVPLKILFEKFLQVYDGVVNETSGDPCASVEALVNIFSDAFKNDSTPAIDRSIDDEFKRFAICALGFRFDVSSSENTFDSEIIDKLEGNIIETLVSGMKKMSKLTFYDELVSWSQSDDRKLLTFYRLSSVMAEELKGQYVPLVHKHLNNMTDILNKTNRSKNKKIEMNLSKELTDRLIRYVLKTLHEVFVNDGQNFMNKERFDLLMPAIVDQIENKLGSEEMFMARNTTSVIPCVAQLVEASVNNAFWKRLNDEILQKTKHRNPLVRQSCLHCLCEIVRKITTDFLPLLPDSIRYLSELLEDDDENVERICRKTIQELSSILGESIENYF